MLTVYPIRLRFIFGYLLVSAPHICKSPLSNSYFFCMVFFLWRTAAFCLLLLYRNKMQHRAFRLYLFAAAVFFRRCFYASAPKTADALYAQQKGYRFNHCPWVCMYVLYMYSVSSIPPELVMRGKSFLYDYIRRFNAVYKKYINPTMKLTNMNIVLSRRCCDTYQ